MHNYGDADQSLIQYPISVWRLVLVIVIIRLNDPPYSTTIARMSTMPFMVNMNGLLLVNEIMGTADRHTLFIHTRSILR